MDQKTSVIPTTPQRPTVHVLVRLYSKHVGQTPVHVRYVQHVSHASYNYLYMSDMLTACSAIPELTRLRSSSSYIGPRTIRKLGERAWSVSRHFALFIGWLIHLRPSQRDDGYTDDRSQNQVHTDEQIQVFPGVTQCLLYTDCIGHWVTHPSSSNSTICTTRVCSRCLRATCQRYLCPLNCFGSKFSHFEAMGVIVRFSYDIALAAGITYNPLALKVHVHISCFEFTPGNVLYSRSPWEIRSRVNHLQVTCLGDQQACRRAGYLI